MARIGATSVVELAGAESAVLTFGRVDLDSSRRVVESLDDFFHARAGVLLCSVDSSKLKVGPVDEVSVNGDGERVNGGGHQNLTTRSVDGNSFDDFSDGVREVEHVLFVVDGEAARLSQVGRDDGFLQSSSHGCSEDLAALAEPSPVGVEHVTLAGMNNDGSGSVDVSNINDLTSVFVHRVDGAVARVRPVNLLVNPIESDSFGIDSLLQNDVFVGFGIGGDHPSDSSFGSDLRVIESAGFVIEVKSNHVGHVLHGLEGLSSVNPARFSISVDVFAPDFSSG